jgi:hypothetical protein
MSKRELEIQAGERSDDGIVLQAHVIELIAIAM